MTEPVRPRGLALLTDLYELTMIDAYLEQGMLDEAVFSLFVRGLPRQRNYLVACGLGDVLQHVRELRFGATELEALSGLGLFSTRLLDWLESFRFDGTVRAVPEGTPIFAQEPLLEVTASLPTAQLVETLVLNQVHLQTVLASKVARVVDAARGRQVVDFGLRRVHGFDAGIKLVRAGYVAGLDATSNVLGGLRYGVPVVGTMAHSYVQAHDDELSAFASFVRRYPEATLLVDTYDTLEGVRSVIELARRLGPAFRVRAVRLDSGDLAQLALSTRQLLDAAGLRTVRIFASGGLDEYQLARLLAQGAPIDGFGVGTRMGVSDDAPSLDMAYKLVAYAGVDRLKRSAGKHIIPGAKQVFRRHRDGEASGDVIAHHDEPHEGQPLLTTVMRDGEATSAGRKSLADARARCHATRAALPSRVRGLEPATPPYPVQLSDRLRAALRGAPEL